MNQTFRLRRSVQVQGIAFGSSTSLVVSVGVVAALLLIHDPKKQGFKYERAVAYMIVMWIAVFGSMTLLSIYLLLAYYLEKLSLDRRTTRVQVGLQNRHFDPVEVDKLIWTATPEQKSRFHRRRANDPIAPPRF